jgi:hypothetical protein
VGDEAPTELVEDPLGVPAAFAVIGEGTNLDDAIEAHGGRDVPTGCPFGIDTLGQLDIEETSQLGGRSMEIDAPAHDGDEPMGRL